MARELGLENAAFPDATGAGCGKIPASHENPTDSRVESMNALSVFKYIISIFALKTDYG